VSEGESARERERARERGVGNQVDDDDDGVLFAARVTLSLQPEKGDSPARLISPARVLLER